MLGKCKLCHEMKGLVGSHVLSEFLYEHTYDDVHRFAAVTPAAAYEPQLHQKGIREPLLCSECEQKIGRFETYAAPLLRRGAQLPFDSTGLIDLGPFDYALLKLFGISLLWRSHLATNDMFAEVRLGPFAEKAREALLYERPGRPWELGFALARSGVYDVAKTVITAPKLLKYHGHRCYHLIAFGFAWAFVVSSDARRLATPFPFVGLESSLKIPITNETKAELFAWLRPALGPPR